jgi:hypothetical protein
MSNGIRRVKTGPEYEVAYQDLCALVNKHSDKLTSLQVLAVAANMLGKLIAMQDQRTVTPEMAMKVVTENLERGNRQVWEQIMQSQGSA